MGRIVQISDAEWVVMEVLWRTQSAAAADVIAELADARDWNHRTVRTLLTRLVNKGALEARTAGHRYIYRSVVSREKCVRIESRSFLDKVFAGNAADLLLHFARHSKITSAQFKQLRQLLDEKESEGEATDPRKGLEK
jgi:BlaI family penicillinase repressor